MSVLGKILAVLNVLAVCAFLVIGAMAYSKRQAWAYVNLRYDMARDGVALDKDDLDRDGNPKVDKYHAKTITDIFGGQVPPDGPTQVGELKRVKKELDAKLDAISETEKQKKIAMYARLLLPMTGNPSDREYLLSVRTFLEEEKGFQEFKKTLAEAMPVAVASFSAQYQDDKVPAQLQKLHFPRQLHDAVEDLPGDPKRRLMYAFLLKMAKSDLNLNDAEMSAAELTWGITPSTTDDATRSAELEKTQGRFKEIRSGIDAMDKKFADAGKAAQAAIQQNKLAREKLQQAETLFDAADRAAYDAEIEYRISPVAAKLKDRNDKLTAKNAAQDALRQARQVDSNLNPPSVDAALAFLGNIRKDLNPAGAATKKIEGYIDAIGDEVLDLIMADLAARYEAAFTAAVTGEWKAPDSGVTEKFDPSQRRLYLARLLFTSIEELNPEDFKLALDQPADKILYDLESFKRYMRIVGISAAVDAINAESRQVVYSAASLGEEMRDERGRFYRNHVEKIIRLKAQADQIEQLEKRLERIKTRGDEQKAVADQNVDRVVKFRDELKTKREETDKEVKKLQDLSDGLFQVRVAYRDAVRDQQKHLENIVTLEEQILYMQAQIEARERELKKRKTMRP